MSKLMRPIFEHRKLRGIVGVNLIGILAFAGAFESPVIAGFPSLEKNVAVEVSVIEVPDEAVVTTERRFQMPVELLGVSQGFQGHHPGVDLRAPLGSPVRPVAPGVVKDAVYSAWGYGQAVVIEHEEGYASMYAHVRRIAVEPGSNVDQNTVIAEVGLTGWTTGPHLHLELYKDGKAVNPQPYLNY